MFCHKLSPEEYRRRRPRCEYCIYSRPFHHVGHVQYTRFPYIWCKLGDKPVRMHIPRRLCSGFRPDSEVKED